ncbi:hypothetical protein LIER_05554 [Lithospermum erythrorhizon]|uniref:Gag-pol polyprotein n=1 Tax=Lithospermum erythrorhizon TaxID=34254 RepID=A0AAV3P2A4_LITER
MGGRQATHTAGPGSSSPILKTRFGVPRASANGKPGKLESPWEGPYLVRRIVGPVTYELETLEGRQVPRSWNACHLSKYYV